MVGRPAQPLCWKERRSVRGVGLWSPGLGLGSRGSGLEFGGARPSQAADTMGTGREWTAGAGVRGVRGEAEGAWSGARRAGPHSDVKDLGFYYVRGPWRILSRRLHWSDLFMLLKTICASIETSFPLLTPTGNRLTSKEKLSFP